MLMRHDLFSFSKILHNSDGVVVSCHYPPPIEVARDDRQGLCAEDV
jgi:hypothetical protein